jgi:alkanesulfonate monooxygenase SsuD/methylene tetrahydromethanopterin reductase-like flavin-dependent oxidoreductase (luciferase family)
LKAGRNRRDIELSSSIFVIPTNDPKGAARYESEARQQISFYASTPLYRPVFDLEGWGGAADQLKAFAAQGRWVEMPALITDEMLDRLVLRGSWAELPGKVLKKYSALLDRVNYYFPVVPGEDEDGWRATVTGFRRQQNS